MKRIFSLIGLLVVGVLLLLDPRTGIVSAASDNGLSSVTVPPATTVTLGEPPPPSATTTTAPPPDDTVGATTTETTTTAAPTTTTASTTTEASLVTALGDSVNTEFGPFQVEIVVENGVLVDIGTVAEPGDRKSQRINGTAIPLYEDAAISAQSADIDRISGATITWRAYTASLDSALTRVGL